ncbi:MAG: phage tail protein [Saprospirales bacterium]|nr:phage tail protein [Saprospirales bacterium]MBK6904949.1 phage tail protein [Saprospirales bacterium]MBK7337626.1 phage tail protein [Saprospirales bacterium]
MAEIYIPPVAFFFSVSVDGGEGNDSSFKEASGMEIEIDIEEINEGGNNNFKHRLPGRSKYRNLVLKRGLVKNNTSLHDWITKILLSEANLDEPVEKKKILVNLKYPDGDVVMSWSFENAFPVKWSISNFNSQENSLVIETLEFAYQKFQVENP